MAFERRVADAFEAGLIRAPVHLSGGNEDALLEIFQQVRPQDWVFSTWRSHYHALLKGIPEEWRWGEIMAGRSMYLCDKEYKIVSSAIVAGCLPIALGVAMAIKRDKRTERVWAFCGDMAAETGTFHEVTKYAGRHDLPITFVIEDNGLSTNTPTQTVWGLPESPLLTIQAMAGLTPWSIARSYGCDVRYYAYERTVPHVGAGQFVVFS